MLLKLLNQWSFMIMLGFEYLSIQWVFLLDLQKVFKEMFKDAQIFNNFFYFYQWNSIKGCVKNRTKNEFLSKRLLVDIHKSGFEGLLQIF